LAKPQLVFSFRTASWKRFEESRFLLDNGYTTIAMYLAGYAVECMLKAVLLAAHPQRRQTEAIREFRGQKAHNFDWLRYRLSRRGVSLPADVSRAIVTVSTWTTDWRYEAKTKPSLWAEDFLSAARIVMNWGQRTLQ